LPVYVYVLLVTVAVPGRCWLRLRLPFTHIALAVTFVTVTLRCLIVVWYGFVRFFGYGCGYLGCCVGLLRLYVTQFAVSLASCCPVDYSLLRCIGCLYVVAPLDLRVCLVYVLRCCWWFVLVVTFTHVSFGLCLLCARITRITDSPLWLVAGLPVGYDTHGCCCSQLRAPGYVRWLLRLLDSRLYAVG